MTLRKMLLLSMALLPAAAFADSSRDSVDWPGQYEGTVPCASCPGIDMQLTLKENGTYRLSETYQGDKGDTFDTKGKFKWDSKGSHITLDDDDRRSFLVGEGQLFMVDADNKPADGYVLRQTAVTGGNTSAPGAPTAKDVSGKGHHFVGGGQNLTVKPNSVASSTMEANGDKHVVFDGLLNFEHRMEGGHKSLTGTFDINCTQNKYDMPAVAYFSDHDAKGKKLHETSDNGDNWLDLRDAEDDVITLAARAYCD